MEMRGGGRNGSSGRTAAAATCPGGGFWETQHLFQCLDIFTLNLENISRNMAQKNLILEHKKSQKIRNKIYKCITKLAKYVKNFKK